MKIFRRVVVCLAVVSFFVMMVSVMPTKAASEEEMMSLSEEKVKARMDAQVDALGAYLIRLEEMRMEVCYIQRIMQELI